LAVVTATPTTPFALLGLPYDAASSFARGAAEAPAAIRRALASPSSNTWGERGVDAWTRLEDGGDVAVPQEPAAARAAIQAAVTDVLARDRRPLCLGGDHSVSYPALRAVAAAHPGVTVVHVDAHGDLYDEFEGDRYSHACPFARVMEEGLAGRLIQIGVRTLNDHQRAQASRFGVEQFGMDQWAGAPLDRLQGPVYVSLDLDALDPAFAPGVSHPEPGGLSVRELVSLLHRLGGVEVVGADVVEYNPRLDLRDLTARVAAKLIKELAGL
jgi:agmatinase